MNEDELPNLRPYEVVCTTPGCPNEAIPITVLAPEIDPLIYCGPCCEPITTAVTTEGA